MVRRFWEEATRLQRSDKPRGLTPDPVIAETGNEVSSTVSQLFMYIGGPVNWNMANRALLVALIVAPLAIWYLLVFHYLMANSTVATYINRDVLAVVIRLQSALVAAWMVLIVVLLLVRKHTPNGRWFVHVLAITYVWTIVYFTFLIGPFTSMFPPVSWLAGLAVGLILFKHTVLPWLLLAFASYVGMILLEQAGWLPYAPLLLEAPIDNGHLHSSWILSIEAVGFSLLPITGALFYFLIINWHAREAQLAQTKERLGKANDIIRRYIPAQVAEGILADIGNSARIPERLKVTVFFSDVVGFSEMADRLDPEDLAHILNEYLSEMADIADRYGGTVDQFVGDGILIFFGAPLATDDRDHALRAVRMGLDMQQRVCDLSAKWQDEVLEHPFSIRVGINTGYASVGDFGSAGRVAYMAVGRTTNQAARLQTNCEPGKILISHATWLLIRDDIACESKDEIEVKGSHFPIKIYEISIDERKSRKSSQSKLMRGIEIEPY